MLANNRTDKLTTRTKYETNSIVINKGHNITGTPSGKKKLNQCKPWIFNA